MCNEPKYNCTYIVDPIRKDNNVVKQSYRLEDVKMSFSYAFDYLSNCKKFYELHEIGKESNAIYELLLSHMKY